MNTGHGLRPRQRLRGACALLAVGALGALPSAAHGAIFGTVTTYPVSITVDAKIVETVHWKGIKAGCYAPGENFDVAYEVSMRTHPQGARSKTRNAEVAIAGITPETSVYGSTFFYGAPNGLRQSARVSSWSLQTAYSGQDCGPDPPPPVPAGISSPTCRAIRERVGASLLSSTEGRNGDGFLLLHRTRNRSTSPLGAGIGASCYRTLHDLDFFNAEAQLALGTRTTVLQVPFPKLRARLLGLARATKNPVYRYRFTVSGDCWSGRMSPSIGRDPAHVPNPLDRPHRAIGDDWSEPGNNTCTLWGGGTVTVRRAGPVRTGARRV